MNFLLTRSRMKRFQDRSYVTRRFENRNEIGIAFIVRAYGSRLVKEALQVRSGGSANDDAHIHLAFNRGERSEDYFYICSLDISYDSRLCVIHQDDLTTHEKAIYLTMKIIQSQGVR